MAYQEITNHLHSLADSERAQHAMRFFKTGVGEYGEGDKFLGIRVPVIRLSVKKYKDTSLDTAEKLLKSEYHEIRLFALLLLVSRYTKGNIVEQTRIYQLYLNSTQCINNWDLVDSSAPYIVGAYLDDNDKSILHELARSSLLWERRIAILATFYFIRKNKFGDALRIAEQLLNDPEDLIHKAVGWMLREIGKRDMTTEVAFLKKYYQQMPRTMLRYAIEKFSKAERHKYLTSQI